MANPSAFHVLPNMVFPSTKMEAVNKLITEGNLTRLINKLIDSDSYIIPTSSTDFSVPTSIKLSDTTETLIPVGLETEDLEFVMHGYYFNLGSISNIINTGEMSNDQKLTARILVDISNPNYPELFGETDIESTWSSTAEITFGTTTIPEEQQQNIYQITATGSDNKIYELSYDEDYILLRGGIDTGISFPNGYTIKHRNYANIINLYVCDISDSLPDLPDTLPAHEDYVLDLLYMMNGNMYFPMSSFAKFSSQSIKTIDGGIIF